MVLSLFGLLVDPTDEYLSEGHKKFSNILVKLITIVVGGVTPVAFIGLHAILFCLAVGLLDLASCDLWLRRLVLGLIVWWAAEVVFFFYCRGMKRKFEVPRSFPGLSQQQREHFVDRVMQQCADPAASLAGWFYTHDPKNLGRECVEEWLSWAFISKNLEDLTEEERLELSILVQPVVDKYPNLGKPSTTSPLNFMKLHFDKMVVQHKPFIAYVVISAMQAFGFVYLTWMGFQHHTLEGKHSQSYWSYRSPRDEVPIKTPVFMVHGIGIGVAMYLKMIKAIVAQDPERPVFIFELPHISLKIVDHVPTMEETIESMDEIFRRHKLKTCSWLAHSYGTIVTTWVLKERPKYINKLSFVDPVCFALWEPDLIFNFLYRKPPGAIHRLMQFFVAQDLLVSYTLFRNFWWLENILFPDDLHCPTQVYLSSHDFIIDSSLIHDYLQTQVQESRVHVPFEITKMHGLAHGSVLNSDKYVRQIINKL